MIHDPAFQREGGEAEEPEQRHLEDLPASEERNRVEPLGPRPEVPELPEQPAHGPAQEEAPDPAPLAGGDREREAPDPEAFEARVEQQGRAASARRPARARPPTQAQAEGRRRNARRGRPL